MKSVKMFGKKMPILGILLIALLASGGVYAALVSYLSNTIDQDVAIDSPIALAGEVKYWPADQGVLGATTDGTAEWSTIQLGHDASYSAYLKATVTGGAEGKIVIPMPVATDLEDIESISWFVYTVAGYPPHVDIILGENIDDDETNIDSLTAELASNVVGYDKANLIHDAWVKTFEGHAPAGPSAIAGDTVLWVTRHGAGEMDAPCGTLAELIAGDVHYPDREDDYDGEPDLDPDIIIGADTEVLRLEIEVDFWPFRESPAIASEAYMDDIQMVLAGTIWDYDLEPETKVFVEGEPTLLPIFAGSEFYFDFSAENQANLEMDGKLQIVITPDTTEFDVDPTPGAEFELYNGYTFTGSTAQLELTTTAIETFEPVIPVELSLHLKLKPHVDPDTYTFTAEIIPEP